MAAVLFGVGTTLAACGSPSTPGVATGTATTTTSLSASSGAGAQGTGLLAYAICMRAHGVTTFPDPASVGGFDNKRAVVDALQAVSTKQANAAQNDCAHVIPAGEGLGGQTVHVVTVQDQQYYLKAVACMRAHGFANFPDPVFSSGGVSFSFPSSIDTNSTPFRAAQRICEKLIPAGLPDSGNGG